MRWCGSSSVLAVLHTAERTSVAVAATLFWSSLSVGREGGSGGCTAESS